MKLRTDPFERAVARAARRPDAMLRTRKGTLRFMTTFHAVIVTGWATVLAGHWLAVRDANAVFQVHAVVFSLFVGAVIAMQILMRLLVLPAMEDEADPPT